MADLTTPYQAPMSAVAKPTQFMSGNEQGKTNTCLAEMSELNKYFMNLGKSVDTAAAIEGIKKTIIHIIFSNNNLIETKQWNNKIANFGVDNVAILSSQDIRTKREVSSLIHDGYDDGGKINYIVCCANSVRLEDIKWLIRTYARDHKDYMFSLYFDEFDALPIYVAFINIIKYFDNVYSMYAISATTYEKWFKLLAQCGYKDIPIITKIEDPSGYRRIRDHDLIYTDKISCHISPVSNFKFILDNPGHVCYDSNGIIHAIPDFKSITGKIIFVPAEVEISTHDAIKDLAFGIKSNVLMINGQIKAYLYPDGRKEDIKDYKKNHSEIPEHAGILDVARIMYADPKLGLKNTNLVITGYKCIERGATFNLPGFQFYAAIFAPYHLKEGSKAVEDIVQLAGRASGGKDNVPPMFIVAPKYLIDEVCDRQDDMIKFLMSNPDRIMYADMIKDPNAIPIRLDFDESVLNILETKKLSKNKKLEIVLDGIKSGKVKFTNLNRKSDIERINFNPLKQLEYTLKTVRICDKNTDPKNYRFDNFLKHHDMSSGYGQSNKEGEFSIDINLIEHKKGVIMIPRGIGFISYAYFKD
jgi:hypothetical protein